MEECKIFANSHYKLGRHLEPLSSVLCTSACHHFSTVSLHFKGEPKSLSPCWWSNQHTPVFCWEKCSSWCSGFLTCKMVINKHAVNIWIWQTFSYCLQIGTRAAGYAHAYLSVMTDYNVTGKKINMWTVRIAKPHWFFHLEN